MNSSTKRIFACVGVALGLAYIGMYIRIAQENRQRWAAFAARLAAADARMARQKAAKTSHATKQLRAYMTSFKSGSVTASWATAIKRVAVKGKTAQIETSLVVGTAKPEVFRAVCMAASNFVYKPQNAALGLSKIMVYDSNGKLASGRYRLDKGCIIYD